MQQCSLRGLAERYKISQIPETVIKRLSISKADLECLQIVREFILKYPTEQNNSCIQISFSKRENSFVVVNDDEFIGMGWEHFLPYHVCFECDEVIALVVVLKYMNQIRATFEDIRIGFKELINQICRNERRYKNKD